MLPNIVCGVVSPGVHTTVGSRQYSTPKPWVSIPSSSSVGGSIASLVSGPGGAAVKPRPTLTQRWP